MLLLELVGLLKFGLFIELFPRCVLFVITVPIGCCLLIVGVVVVVVVVVGGCGVGVVLADVVGVFDCCLVAD